MNKEVCAKIEWLFGQCSFWKCKC